MSVLSSLLPRRPSRERPDLAAWLAGARPLLVVDASGEAPALSAPASPDAVVLEHRADAGSGLPFHDREPRRLAARDAEYGAVVLAEVLDRVIDVGPAVDEARRVLAPRGLFLVLQTVAPDGYEERAIWNAIARMRDARHTWTPSARQLEVLVSSWRMDVVHEAAWEETTDPLATRRPETERCLAQMLDAAAARGSGMLRGDELVLSRRATLLRKG